MVKEQSKALGYMMVFVLLNRGLKGCLMRKIEKMMLWMLCYLYIQHLCLSIK